MVPPVRASGFGFRDAIRARALMRSRRETTRNDARFENDYPMTLTEALAVKARGLTKEQHYRASCVRSPRTTFAPTFAQSSGPGRKNREEEYSAQSHSTASAVDCRGNDRIRSEERSSAHNHAQSDGRRGRGTAAALAMPMGMAPTHPKSPPIKMSG